jgi:hypothetical protein
VLVLPSADAVVEVPARKGLETRREAIPDDLGRFVTRPDIGRTQILDA